MKAGPRSGRPDRSLDFLRPGFSFIATIFLGLLTATLAFSHAAVQIGLDMDIFRPLGGSFFSGRAGQIKLATEAVRNDGSRRQLPLVEIGQQMLRNAPLSPGGLWFVGLGKEAGKDMAGARRAMVGAERLTRREPSVQLWLGTDALKRGKVDAGFRHFDILLRTTPEVSQEILPQLALAVLVPEGRAALKPYIRASNPWVSHFLVVAVDKLPRVAPLGLLLSEPGVRPPDTPMARAAYATLTRRLVAEGAYDIFTRVYPKLPGAEPTSLTGLGLEFLTTANSGYAPAIWDFGTSSDRGGAPVALDGGKIGLEFHAAPGTVGAAGTKLIAPGARRVLRWTVLDRVANSDASARWVATCVGPQGDGASTSSSDMVGALPVGRLLELNLPAKCPMIRLDLRFAGGTGRQSASVTVGNLALVADRDRTVQ